MYRKVLVLMLMVFFMAGSLAFAAAAKEETRGAAPAVGPIKPVDSIKLFRGKKFDAHYRAPNESRIETILDEEGIPLTGGLSGENRIGAFKKEWMKRNPTTVNPAKLRKLLEQERTRSIPQAKAKAAPTEYKILVVPVEFPESDTFNHCDVTVTTTGPLHNQIAAPGSRDNNTVWYKDATPALYTKLYFGTGPNAGVVIDHPNLGKVSFKGMTMANYYLEQSGGTFKPTGFIYPKWLQAAHSEGWYGAEGCGTGSHNVRAQDLVKEVIGLVNTDNPDFNWQGYDADGDGIVDNFTVIHAGEGQEGGGGVQGEYAIWSHASHIDYPTGYLVCTKGSTGCPDRNIYVREYSMDPENVDVGVISEEFGHAVFGLPDIYTTDYQASPSNWAIFESGSWNGKLGGMQPAPFPLWARYMVGWATPAEVTYTTAGETFKVGQHSLTPKNTASGIKINLPDEIVTITNKAGTGQAWWSDNGNLVENTLTRTIALTATATPVFSFASYWSIEKDWDYGYVEVSTDGGTTWTMLDDTGSYFTTTNPNGTNQGTGLTGTGSGTLSFDLSAYNGQVIKLRLRYSTDTATVLEGWWADNFTLVDGVTTLFSDDVEGGEGGWTKDGWRLVPLELNYPIYYLAEWRNMSGFDQGLKYPYQTVYNGTEGWEVDRCTHSVPGMLLWLRNGLYNFDYTLYDASFIEGPSMGPKHALLVVDSHYWPMGFDNWVYSGSNAPYRISNRCQPADATFSLKKTTKFKLRLGSGDDVLETKTFAPRPAVPQFHDSLGYYPGILYNPSNGKLYYWQLEASAVVPARGDYTTRVTDVTMAPYTGQYGYSLGYTVLGTGNPGDNSVQHGVHLAVTKQADDGKWGQIMVWNSETLTTLGVTVDKAEASAGEVLKYTLTVTNSTPVAQHFTVTSPIPANTTYKSGASYKKSAGSIIWSGSVKPGKAKSTVFSVKVNAGTGAGTVITNSSTLTDDALGGKASVTATVK